MLVALLMNPLAIVKLVPVTGQRAPLVPGGSVAEDTVVTPEPVVETQFGNVVQAPLTQVIFSGPPTLVNPALQVIGTNAPEMTLVVFTPSVGKVTVPALVILVMVVVDCKKAVRLLNGQRPVATQHHERAFVVESEHSFGTYIGKRASVTRLPCSDMSNGCRSLY